MATESPPHRTPTAAVGVEQVSWKETFNAVGGGGLLLFLLSRPAFQSFFFAENFQYLWQYRANGGRFWPAILSPTDNIFFRPVFFAFSLPWFRLLPADPSAYHLRNYLFSVINLLLLHRVLARVVRTRAARVLAVLFFALSKVHLTTIGYINIFDSILMLMLLLLTILFFLRFASGRRLSDYLLGLLFCMLSVFSKDYGLVAVVVVAALAATRGAGGGRKALGWWAARLSPLAVIVLIYLGLRYSIIGTFAGPPTYNPIYSPQFSFKIAALKSLMFVSTLGNLSLTPGGVTGASGLGFWLMADAGKVGSWASTPQYGTVSKVCLGDAILCLGFVGLVAVTLWRARGGIWRLLFPLVWVSVYFGPTLLTRNFQMYYNYEPLAGAVVLLGICLEGAGRRLLYVWAAALLLIGVNGAISNYRSTYNWQYAAAGALRAKEPLIDRYRGRPVESITFITADAGHWGFTLGGYPMLAELLGRPKLAVTYISYEEAPAQLARADDKHLLFDIDNGFLEYPRQLRANPLTLKGVHPPRAEVGVGFQIQPNGQSALGLLAENVTPGTVVLVDDTPLPTTYVGPTFLTAMFPNELLRREGRYSISITDRLRRSNAVEFVVEPIGGSGVNITTPEAAAHASEHVGAAAKQLDSLIGNVKGWGAKGNSYQTLDLKRALAEGLFPAEMAPPDGVPTNPWGGPVNVGPAPPGMGGTFLVVFSGVPDEECVRLSLSPSTSFRVYAGTFLDTSSPSTVDAAKSLCTTGNMWFVAR